METNTLLAIVFGSIAVIMFVFLAIYSRKEVKKRGYEVMTQLDQQFQLFGIESSVLETVGEHDYYLQKSDITIYSTSRYKYLSAFDIRRHDIDYALYVLNTHGNQSPTTDEHLEFLIAGSLTRPDTSGPVSTGGSLFDKLREKHTNLFYGNKRVARLTVMKKFDTFGKIVDILWEGDDKSADELNANYGLKTEILQSLQKNKNLRDLILFCSEDSSFATIQTRFFVPTAEEWAIISTLAHYIKSSWFAC